MFAPATGWRLSTSCRRPSSVVPPGLGEAFDPHGVQIHLGGRDRQRPAGDGQRRRRDRRARLLQPSGSRHQNPTARARAAPTPYRTPRRTPRRPAGRPRRAGRRRRVWPPRQGRRRDRRRRRRRGRRLRGPSVSPGRARRIAPGAVAVGPAGVAARRGSGAGAGCCSATAGGSASALQTTIARAPASTSDRRSGGRPRPRQARTDSARAGSKRRVTAPDDMGRPGGGCMRPGTVFSYIGGLLAPHAASNLRGDCTEAGRSALPAIGGVLHRRARTGPMVLPTVRGRRWRT